MLHHDLSAACGGDLTLVTATLCEGEGLQGTRDNCGLFRALCLQQTQQLCTPIDLTLAHGRPTPLADCKVFLPHGYLLLTQVRILSQETPNTLAAAALATRVGRAH